MEYTNRTEEEQSQQQSFENTQVNGNDNIFNAIQARVVTLTQNKIVQVSVDEVKTRPFIIHSPYKGLKSFELADKDQFFGRDQFIAGLIDELEQTNMIFLLGGSGSGKSSVIRAGLVPWLSQQWGTLLVNLTLTPDRDPFEALYGSLLGHFKQSRARLARDGQRSTLTQLVRQLKQPESFWLIFIDQFEELFTLSDPEKRDRFILSLAQLCQDHATDRSIKIVATMRADFLDQLDNEPANYLARLTQRHRPLMTRMHPDELRLAIEQPAAHHGVVFEQGLVETIIKDVQEQAGYLPLLQYTLDQLWESEVSNGGIHDRTLNIQSYRLLGGVRGALQKQVTQFYQALSHPKQQAVQRIFLKLVGVGGDRTTDTDWKPVRKRELRSRFTNPLEQTVLSQLVDANLLVSDAPTTHSQATIEIAHEILLTSWDKLREWIEQNREAIALRNRINEDAARWKVKKLDDELWSGTKLAQAVDLQKDRTFNQVLGGLNPEAARFIRASVGLSERQAQEKEAQQKKELEQQKRLLVQEQKARKLAQRITVGAAIGGLIMTGLALVAGANVRRAAIQQIETSVALSDAHLLNGQELEADVESIRAAKKLKAPLWRAIVPNRLEKSVAAQLQQTAASGHERNQFQSDQSELWNIFTNSDNSRIAVQEERSVRLLNVDGSSIATITNENSDTMGQLFSPDGKRFITFDGFNSDSLFYLWDANTGTKLATLKSDEHVSLFTSDIVVVFSLDSTSFATVGEDSTLYIWDSNGKKIATIEGYQQMKPSPDSKSIAALSEDGGIHLWNFDGKKIASLKRDQPKANRYEFSPDGNRIAILRENNSIDLWDLSNDKVTTLTSSQKVSYKESKDFIAFSPEGARFATAGKDGTVLLWNAEGTELATLDAHEGDLTALEFSPTGDRFITIGDNKGERTMRIWKANGTAITTLKSDEIDSGRFEFSPDGTRLITYGKDDTIDLRDADGTWIASFEESTKYVRSLYKFSPDGSKQIFVSGEDGTVRLRDFNGKQIAVLGRHQSEIVDMAFTSENTQLVTTGVDGTARFWKLNNDAFPSIRGAEEIYASPDGAQIAIQNEDNTLYLWNFKKMESILLEDCPPIQQFVFSLDSSHLAAEDEEGTVHIWDTNGNKITTLENPQSKDFFQGLVGLVFSADGTQVATAIDNPSKKASSNPTMTVYRWNINGEKIASFDNVPSGWVYDAVFNSDGLKLAIYNRYRDNEMPKIWDSANGKTITLKGHKGNAGKLKFTLDGTQIISEGADDSTIRLWDIKGNEIAVFEGHKGAIYDVTLSPDGKHIATAGSDGTLRLWDTNGNELDIFRGHQRSVNAIRFSPDGTQLASGGHDGTVRLWDLQGNELARLESNQRKGIRNIEFSSDGDWLTIDDEDNTVRQWHLYDTDDLLAKQCNWVRDYLKNSNAVEEADRTLCDDVIPSSTSPAVMQKETDIDS